MFLDFKKIETQYYGRHNNASAAERCPYSNPQNLENVTLNSKGESIQTHG